MEVYLKTFDTDHLQILLQWKMWVFFSIKPLWWHRWESSTRWLIRLDQYICTFHFWRWTPDANKVNSKAQACPDPCANLWRKIPALLWHTVRLQHEKPLCFLIPPNEGHCVYSHCEQRTKIPSGGFLYQVKWKSGQVQNRVRLNML